MTNLEFAELCRDTCLILNVDDTASLSNQGQIDIDGVSIGAFFDQETDTAIHCYVDLGEVDGQRKLESYEEILALNLELGRMHGESLGFDADTGRVVLRSEILDPDSCNAEHLAEWFLDYARFAKEFQQQMHSGAGGEERGVMQDMLA